MGKKKAAVPRRPTIKDSVTFIIAKPAETCRKENPSTNRSMLSSKSCTSLCTNWRSALSEAGHSSQVYPQSHKLLVITIAYYVAGIHTVCIPYLESITSILCIGGDRTCSN